MKNNKGITLIALVVTIIVLLILAGVSIAMLSGQNGILNRASQATWKSKLGDAESTVALSVSNFLTDYYAVKYTGSTSEYTATYTIGDATVEADAIVAAGSKAQSELGTYTAENKEGYTITVSTTGENSNKKVSHILIVYHVNGKVYSVKGTINGSSVQWGNMYETATGEAS